MTSGGSRLPLAITSLLALAALTAPGCVLLQDPRESLKAAEIDVRATRETTGAVEPTLTPPPHSAYHSKVYLTTIDRVKPAVRYFEQEPTAKNLVEELLKGPTDDEQKMGMYTSVPGNVSLRGISVDDKVATVDLSGGFEQDQGPHSHVMRLAQLVYTLTELPDVDSVVLKVAGSKVTEFGPQDLLIEGALDRDGFEEVEPQVLIDEPASNEVVSSPVRVRGTAKIDSDVFKLSLFDQRGNVLALETVEVEPGVRKQFELRLAFPRSTRGRGEIEVSYALPSEGGRDVVAARLPVYFEE